MTIRQVKKKVDSGESTFSKKINICNLLYTYVCLSDFHTILRQVHITPHKVVYKTQSIQLRFSL